MHHGNEVFPIFQAVLNGFQDIVPFEIPGACYVIMTYSASRNSLAVIFFSLERSMIIFLQV